MEIGLEYVPTQISLLDITRHFATVLHSEELKQTDERKVNFQIRLGASSVSEVRNDGTGVLTIPDEQTGRKFLSYVRDNPILLPNEGDGRGRKKKIRLFVKGKPYDSRLALTLAKTPFIDPQIIEDREEILRKLDCSIRVDAVQFGILFSSYPITENARSFSNEWERTNVHQSTGFLQIEYDHKLFRIRLGNQLTDEIEQSIAISFSSVQKIGVGQNPEPYICFDLRIPPIFEETEFFRTITGQEYEDTKKFKRRVGSLHSGHARVAPYAKDLRIKLAEERDLDQFISMCQTARAVPDRLVVRLRKSQIEAAKFEFFSMKCLRRLEDEFKRLPWNVAFQLEALLRNSLLHTKTIDDLLPKIRELCRLYSRDDCIYVGDLLRRYNDELQAKPRHESPEKCFDRVRAKFVRGTPMLPAGNFACCHVTFTPTRTILEGPYATQSNRVIREYRGYENNFIRVDFRDEDRLQFRWDREVDGDPFLRDRVGGILKNGFQLGGRHFEFLAYSSSALREHAVWFIHPFRRENGQWVTGPVIRESLGDFRGTKLLKCPSKYAARVAQAFTATDPSVVIEKGQWEEVDDIDVTTNVRGREIKYTFTDGVGTISEALGDQIWAELCKNRRDQGARSVKPSVYQIRFLGYKGVVSVDKALDNHPDGIKMRLRPSMRKFDNSSERAEIEIAMAFEHPNTCYLNRPLIMLLEDLGIRLKHFKDLQDKAVKDVMLIDDSIEEFCRILIHHHLGTHYRLPYLLKRLSHEFDLELEDIDNPFLMQLRRFAEADVLREIKHGARIPIPDSYLLVGVADEGPTYRKEFGDDVYTLPEGHIYACIQDSPDEKPVWIKGACSISRSPVVHPGDVQRVYAIGEPPANQRCLFRHLKNCVVFSCAGPRPLPSCLGGGDLDGDLFSVIRHAPLLPRDLKSAAPYADGQTWELDRDSTVDDICDFIVEYIRSDVLGLLSDRLLIIADQSKDGMFDDKCLELAELCSQAVDYPKQGIPVKFERLPGTLIRCKPDWHRAEIASPRETDYYESDRALGHLYRAININPPKPDEPQPGIADPDNPITLALEPRVRGVVKLDPQKTENVDLVQAVFRRYRDELSYICSTHTLSDGPDIKLREAEVALGTILAKCSQKRWRKDRMYRMRLHASAVSRDIQRDMVPDLNSATQQDLVVGLRRAWYAWEFSNRYQQEFGANTFGLISLGVIFDCLDRLAGHTVLEEEEETEAMYATNTDYWNDVSAEYGEGS
ncbi:RdRP-domain-containing protein [Pluteus cervinus]|uniref:RdRP-domain-containing protein n=1 Tax=Pluteus cervinus TaxID=181527 RepID=A0ACD3BDK4_9AGAR|nr:RdRP-domain-containing protein [Pluteus cervinus]